MADPTPVEVVNSFLRGGDPTLLSVVAELREANTVARESAKASARAAHHSQVAAIVAAIAAVVVAIVSVVQLFAS